MISDLVARWKLQAILVQFEQAVACFTRARPRRIAYRIVGNAADAEDIVQYNRILWPSCDRSRVQAPAAFLAKDCGVGHLSQHDELRGLSKHDRRAAECS